MNTQKVKEIAQLANELGGIAHYLRGKKAMEAFSAEFTPAVVVMVFEQLEAAERERDEAILTRLEVSEGLSIATRRYEAAEAELARRDAAAREVVGYGFQHKETGKFGSWLKPKSLAHDCDNYCAVPLYTAAPPAVLPPEMDRSSMFDRITEQEEDPIDSLDLQVWGYNLCLKDIKSQISSVIRDLCPESPPAVLLQSDIDRIVPAIDPDGLDEAKHYIEHAIYVDRERIRSELKELVAQQQRVVEIPELETWRKPDSVRAQSAYRNTIIQLLDAANVKWEVKK